MPTGGSAATAVQLWRQDRDPHRALRLVQRPVRGPGPGEVAITVQAAAVCRTDLQLVCGDLPAHRLPVVPGHQVVGRITAVGAGVDAARVGEQVGLVWLAGSCGACRFCRQGRENLCRSATFTGWDVDGGWAKAVVAQAGAAHRIGDLGPDYGDGARAIAPLLCGGVIGYRSLRIAGLLPEAGSSVAGARLGLYGFGASAGLALQVARFLGIECYVVTRTEREVRRALDLGAVWAGGYEQSPPQRLDAAITFAPSGDVVASALAAVDRGGVVAINAIHLDRIPQLDYDDLWWERSLRSVANVTGADVAEFLDIVPRAGVRTAYEVLPLEQAATALRRLAAGDVTGAFVLVPNNT